MEGVQIAAEEIETCPHVFVMQLKYTDRIAAAVDGFADHDENKLRMRITAPVKTLAVHGCLNVVTELFDVPGKARHIADLFNIDNDRPAGQVFIRTDTTELLCLPV